MEKVSKEDNKVLVYISSPYTQGDKLENVMFQMDVVEELYNLGYLPFSPLYSHFQEEVHPRDYESWMEIDLEWVKRADCVLRLGGYSPGGDREVAFAKELGKPVFFGMEDMDIHYNYKLDECKG